MIISFEVVGLPKAQPRARAVNRGKRAGIYTPDTANGWKEAVKAAAIDAMRTQGCFRLGGLRPLQMTLVFSLPAPKGWRTPTGKPTKKCPDPVALNWSRVQREQVWRRYGGDYVTDNKDRMLPTCRIVYPDCQKPDWDNLGKSTCDALNDCGFWHDDAQCHDVHVIRWRSFDPPGAIITVETI